MFVVGGELVVTDVVGVGGLHPGLPAESRKHWYPGAGGGRKLSQVSFSMKNRDIRQQKFSPEHTT